MTVPNRTVVTGATSFIGRALCDALAKADDEVFAIIRPSSDAAPLQALPAPPGIIVDDGDIGSLANALHVTGAETVIHLAGQYVRDHDSDDVEPLLDANVGFGLRLLEAMRHAGIRRLVNTGSYFEHMDGEGHRPVNLYAATKRAFAELVSYHADAHGLQATTLVLFDTFGPGDRRGKLLEAARAAAAAGSVLPVPEDDLPLDMVFISDVCAAFQRAAQLLCHEPDAVVGREFAVRHGHAATIRDIVSVFERATGRPIAVEAGAWPARARNVGMLWNGPPLPGWHAEVDLNEGIRRYLQGEAADED